MGEKIKYLSILLMVVLATQFMGGSFPAAFAADDDPTVKLHVANKVDVALAIGPTNIDYSTFETDLRAALNAKEHPIPEEDLYISATKAVDANSTSEFSWWAYDHTKPKGVVGSGTTATPNYGGVSKVSDTTHTYIENDLGNSTTTSNQGAVNTTPGSVTYTPNPNNVDIGSTRHPYQGINEHMVESSGGATMDFYGYAHDSYKDFRYLPNHQKTKKVFEFAIEEDVAYDALDGVGFFFNTEITGSYENKTQTMNGYLLFLTYSSSGRGASMDIYKFKDVNTYRFHQSMNSTTATTTTSYKISTFPGFTSVGSSTVYSSTDKYRRIKLEVYPSYISAYYSGSATDANVLTTPITETATPVSFGAVGKQVALDQAYITGYGFGPMASYNNHTCARPTHLALQNLSMEMEVVKTLPEVVRQPEWHDDTLKYLVNLNEDKIEDFSSTSITAELLARLTTDDIYYIGWCSDKNADESQEFLDKHNLKGKIVNTEVEETDTYEKQIQAIADKIYERYWKENSAENVLVTDKVILDVQPTSIKTDTADPEWPEGKWKVVHRSTADLGWDSGNEGTHSSSGTRMSDLEFQFNVPGEYDIYYRDAIINSITAHRAPIAQFNVDTANRMAPVFTDTSYDPDDLDSGIIEEKTTWSWLDLNTMVSPLEGTPAVLEEDHLYLITLTVTDKLGASSTTTRQISVASEGGEDPAKKNPPYAFFTLTPGTIMKGVGNQEIKIINGSHDLYGEDITSSFIVTKDGQAFTELTLSATGDGVYDVSGLPVGSYAIELKVTSSNGESQPMVRRFEIIADTIKPTATAAPSTETKTGNISTTLTFKDEGGSGLSMQRAVVTSSTEAPGNDAGWTSYSGSSLRTMNIRNSGVSYVHWFAVDKAGNEATGYFGPYTVNKVTTTMTLTASPAIEQTYGAGKVILTASLGKSAEEYDEGTKIFFYAGSTVVGSAEIVRGEAEGSYTATATVEYNPVAAGDIILKATFAGDSIHRECEGTLSYKIKQSSDANITAPLLESMEYCGNPYPDAAFTVTYAESGETISDQYNVSYEGHNGTSYVPSSTPPTNVGSYRVTGTTSNTNYEEKTSYADFAITPLQLVVILTVHKGSAESAPVGSGDLKLGDNALLKARISNAIELPPGKVAFSVNGVKVAEEVVSSGDSALANWLNVPAGEYDLKAEYVPALVDNYSTGSATISDFSISKANQSDFGFVEGTAITKVYGDASFAVSAIGGQSTGGVTYELISGEGVVSFSPSTQVVSILSAGTATIRATKVGDSSYNQITADITITVNKAHNTLVASVGDIKHGEVVQPQITQNASNGSLGYTYTGSLANGTIYGPSSAPPTEVGIYSVLITSAETINYKEASIDLDFTIDPCDCSINDVVFNDGALEIGYYELQASKALSYSANFSGCGNHNEFIDTVFEIVSDSNCAKVDAKGKLTVNHYAIGTEVQVKITHTHLETGATVSKIAKFTVTKGTAPTSEAELKEAGYDKNTCKDITIDISAYPDGVVDIFYKGLQLTEGQDYSIEDGKLIFPSGFLETLPGNNEAQFTVLINNGTELDLRIHVNRGDLSVDLVVHPDLPKITTDCNMQSLLVSARDLSNLEDGYHVKIEMTASPVKTQSDVEIIENNKGDKLVGLMMDITPYKWVGYNENPEYIKELDTCFTFIIDLPVELRGHDGYEVARVHHVNDDNDSSPQFDMLNAEIIHDGAQLKFETDCFSTIAILHGDSSDTSAYVETDGELRLSKTGDFAWPVVGICSILLMAALGVLVAEHKRRSLKK